MKPNIRKIRAIDVEQPLVASLFTGGGGLDLGLEAAGFKTGFANDIDPYSTLTLQWGKAQAKRLGLPIMGSTIVHREDVNNLQGKFILEALGVGKGELQILAGGPPCQAFSVFGKRQGRTDHRGKLVHQYFRLLSELRPEIFIFENVYGLLTVEGGEVFKEACKHLSRPNSSLRYELSILRLNAVDFGVPQFRDRIIIVGTRSGKRIEEVPRITSETDKLFGDNNYLKWRTVRDALRGLPPIGSDLVSNHTGRKHSARIVERYGNLAPGERDHFTRINKLDPNRPSYTIIVGSDKGGGKGHVHPTLPREVTPRESARIQTFPDWWKFSGSVRHPIRQIGNAVPPLLAGSIGNAIREQILNIPPVPFSQILTTLGQEHLFHDELDKI